jgi:ABC-type transporter MlaC component
MAQGAAGASPALAATASKSVKTTTAKANTAKVGPPPASPKLAGKAKPLAKAASVSKKPSLAKKIALAAKKPSLRRIAAAAPKPAAPRPAVRAHAAAAAPASAAPAEARTAAAVPVSLSLTVDAASPAAAAVTAADPKTAAAFVAGFLGEAFRIARLADANSLQRRARLAELFADKIDMKRIAGYTAADELAGKSADIQQRFRTILVSYLVETYYPQLELASGPGIRVDTAPVEPLADGTAVVWTTFTKDGWGSQSVKWHVAAEGGHYKVIDIFTAGASLVQMERDTFRSVMRDGGLATLMAKLDARTRELASAATE